MASSSASDSQYCPRWKYDVFLSFRGADTRKIFTGHLYEGLKNRGIFTFQDDKRLENDDSIPEELLKAIEESQIALVIFSKNYATSRWCLNELVKIMECKVKNGQKVIPVFYDVYASQVRKQTESFAEAFTKHESKYKNDIEGMQKVKGWRAALSDAADLKGCNIHDRIESECIQELVDDVSSKLCKTCLSYCQDIVGIDIHLEKVKSLLEMEMNDVRIVGIWGIGGVGKTTIAKAIFDTLSYQFKAACFLADVKENARKNQLHSLQNTLLSELLRKKDDYVNNKYDGKSMIPSRLSSMKVLIVLDDIDHGDQLEYLAGDVGCFGNGSRIIVTTRNRLLIEKDDAIYKVPTLPDNEAMQLFNQHAFKKEVPDECFKKLSLEVVNHAKGLPLALKVWGSLLHKKGLTQWRRTVDQIKKNSNSEIVEKLKISYDGLEPEEQKIFLDISCLFRGYDRKEVMQILESCDFGAEYGLDVLIDKSLVFISEDDEIEMHDLIEDMGRYIVKMQKASGKQSRIWNVEDFEDVMVDTMGSIMEVEAIRCDYIQNPCFSREAMQNMKRLRILYFYSRGFPSYSEDIHNDSFEYLPNNLCCINWSCYPWKSLSENFNLRKLVHLDLHGSSLHHLWNETKQLPSLRRLDLNYSRSLKRTPDITGMPNLEYLDLSFCMSLEEVHHSLRCSRKLIELNLSCCKSLERFSCVNVESLESLNLDKCYSLKKFPEVLGIMKPELKIIMSYSGIRELPLSIIHLTKLDLSFMNKLVSLPSSICKFKDLVKLDVSNCAKLESLPEEIGDLEKLEYLNASYTLISRPPSSIVWLNKLKFLTFAKKKSDDGAEFVFPRVNEGLRSLEDLSLFYCNLIDGGLPEDIGSLSSLKKLDLSYCNLIAGGLLKDIGSLFSLKKLDLSCCNIIAGGFPEDIGSLSSLIELNLKGNSFEHLPRSIAQLGALRSLDLSECWRLTQLPELPQHLHTIYADWNNDSFCNSLFQNISSLQHDNISASHSRSLRVFTSWSNDSNSLFKNISSFSHDFSASHAVRVFSSRADNISSWFHYQGTGTSVLVNLPENWYVSDKFLGFAVCYSGKLIDTITAHLMPLCDARMIQKLALSNHSEYTDESADIHFLLIPLGGLWDACKANGKTPNDYGCIRLYSPGEMKEFEVRLLYKDESEVLVGIRRSRYEEASCSSSKKQRSAPVLQLFPTSPGL